jgi:hypothetical protein
VRRRSHRELISEFGLQPIGTFACAPAGMRKEKKKTEISKEGR